MIDFEMLPTAKQAKKGLHDFVKESFRKVARYYDDHEHEEVKEAKILGAFLVRKESSGGEKKKEEQPAEPKRRGAGETMVVVQEELAWGDAVATPEQKARFGGKGASMAITEPGCGSDSSAITTTARLDPATNEWIINGEKIFVTGGRMHANVVVWATLDRSMGRAAIKSFVVEKGTPGMTLTKLEHKLGIRASDTASIVFEDCRIPYDNILGSPEIKPAEGFKGVMKTFDATRPGVAAMAIGVARAALEFTKETMESEGFTFPYDRGQHQLNVVQKAMIEMEANLEVARLLTWRSAVMLDTGERNSLEASMAKAKAGRAATLVTQKCVELLGSKGYSCEWLVEKWMRDCKINDIFEGTGQIQMLIIARTILGYTREQLK
jgi:acyl-CoA dehydrogenase